MYFQRLPNVESPSDTPDDFNLIPEVTASKGAALGTVSLRQATHQESWLIVSVCDVPPVLSLFCDYSPMDHDYYFNSLQKQLLVHIEILL